MEGYDQREVRDRQQQLPRDSAIHISANWKLDGPQTMLREPVSRQRRLWSIPPRCIIILLWVCLPSQPVILATGRQWIKLLSYLLLVDSLRSIIKVATCRLEALGSLSIRSEMKLKGCWEEENPCTRKSADRFHTIKTLLAKLSRRHRHDSDFKNILTIIMMSGRGW